MMPCTDDGTAAVAAEGRAVVAFAVLAAVAAAELGRDPSSRNHRDTMRC